MRVCMCVCERAYQLYCVSLSSPPRIAVLTAGYKGLFQNCKNKDHVVVTVMIVFNIVIGGFSGDCRLIRAKLSSLCINHI